MCRVKRHLYLREPQQRPVGSTRHFVTRGCSETGLINPPVLGRSNKRPFEGQLENCLLLKCRASRHIDLKLLKKVVWPQVWGGGDFGAKPLSSLKALHLALVL